MEIVQHAVLCILLARYTRTDLRDRKIWWPASAAVAAAGVIWHIVRSECQLADSMQGMLIGLLLFLVSKATGGSIGTGDCAALIACGAWLGFAGTLELLTVGLCLAAFWAIGLLIRGKQKNTQFPFMPFLLAAKVLQMLQG